MKNVIILVNPLKFMNSAEFRKGFSARVQQLNQMLGGARCILAMPDTYKGYVRCSEIKDITDVWFYSSELLEYLLVSESDVDTYLFPFSATVDGVFLDRKGEILPLDGDGIHMWVRHITKENKELRKSSIKGLIVCSPFFLFFARGYKEKFLNNCEVLKNKYPECSLSVAVPKRLEKSAKDLFAGSEVISSLITYHDYGDEEMCLVAGDSSQINSNIADVLFHYDGQDIKARYLTEDGRKLITCHTMYDDIADVILTELGIDNN